MEKGRCAHHDETDHGNDGHEDARTFAKSECVELHEWLWGIERKERVQFWNTEQEEDRGDESKHTGGDRARDDSSTSNDAVVAKNQNQEKPGESIRNSLCIFRLFGDVARRIKASYRARGEEAGEYPHQVSLVDSRESPTTHNDRSQFHPPGAPVPLSFISY